MGNGISTDKYSESWAWFLMRGTSSCLSCAITSCVHSYEHRAR